MSEKSGVMNEDSIDKKRSLWGWGIAAVYTAFALGTLGMVFLTSRHRVELVSKDYYAKEIAFDKQLNRERETQAIDDLVKCFVTDDGRFIKLSFPAQQGAVRGTLTLYRPSDSDLDREVPLAVNAEGIQLIATDKLAKGLWRAKVQWEAEGREYYKEFVITI